MESVWTPQRLKSMDKLNSTSSFNDEQLERIARAVGDKKKILDLAVGYANLAKRLVEGGKVVHGLDNNPHSLRYAREKVGDEEGFYLVRADMHAVPYREAFDGVTCVSTMTWSDLDVVIDQMYEALAPGGIVAVSGKESDKKRLHQRNLEIDVLSAASRGFTISREDMAVFDWFKRWSKSNQAYEAGKVEESLDRTRSLLEKRGFEIVESERFYEGTAYFVHAVKN